MAKIDVSLSPRSGPGPGPAPALLLFIVVGAQRVQMEEQQKEWSGGVVLHQEASGWGCIERACGVAAFGLSIIMLLLSLLAR